jgi:hypothetical protein
VDVLTVREMYEKFENIVDSYTQRGYSMNNITKALENDSLGVIL